MPVCAQHMGLLDNMTAKRKSDQHGARTRNLLMI